MGHHYHSHHSHFHHPNHSHHTGSSTSKNYYDPKKNRRQKIVGIVMSVIAAVLLALGIVFIMEFKNQMFPPCLIVVGFIVLVIGLSLLIDACLSRKESAKFVRCIDCGTVNKNGRKLCEKCGKPLRTFCTRCGAELNGGNFCNACGHTSQFKDVD